MGTGFGCRLAGMETMFVSYTIDLRGFLSFCCTILAVLYLYIRYITLKA